MTQLTSQLTDTPDPEAGQRGFPDWLLATALALATLALFWPATQCGFLNFDDNLYVTANAQVQKGLNLENVEWAFTNPVSANWHPLTMMSHMLDCQLFGLKPWGHHLTSILLHCAQHRPGFSAAAPHFWRALAERVGGGTVRMAPLARGVGGLGGGTEGCAQHAVLPAFAAGVREVCRGRRKEDGERRTENGGRESAIRGPWSVVSRLGFIMG